MRGLAHARVRGGLGIVASCVVGAAAILAVNVLIMGLSLVASDFADAKGVGPEAEEVSRALTGQDGSYALSADVTQALRDHGCWALLIDAGGQVAWGLDVPADVPTSYALADVASFSRWYLSDYPVSCWRYGAGLVVVGAPRDSVWKYSVSSSIKSLGATALLLPVVFLADLVVLVVLARLFARRSWRQRDNARNEWVAAVSHDVRTPLAVVVADASELAGSQRLDGPDRARAERIVAKSRETAELLSDLNSVNRLRYSMEPVDAREVHLAAVLRLVVAGFLDGGAGGCELELDVSPAAEDACLRGSEALLRRMVTNLVGNSIRHNPQGCHVRVSLDVRGGLLGTALGRRCVLTVSDDGRGFGAETLSTLRHRPGDELPEHGLGLVIVRRIAAAHGGRAGFANDERGGCSCTVELPIVARRA